MLAVTGGLLIAVFFSRPVNNAHRWLNIGPLGIQPSELAKIAVVLFAALTLERRMHRVNDLTYSLAPIWIVSGALFTLIVLTGADVSNQRIARAAALRYLAC